MVSGVCRLTLYLEAARSLKDKCAVFRKLHDKIRNDFNVSIAEVADNDQWQRLVLGISAVGNDTAFVQSSLDHAVNKIESLYVGELINRESTLMHYNDSEPLAS